jgi:hypothetical protein
MRFSSLLTVLLRSSTAASVIGAIALICEEKCGGDVKGDEKDKKMRGPLGVDKGRVRNGSGQSRCG